MTNYAAMAARIRKCATPSHLTKCERSLTRLWDNGIFTVSEFTRLDSLLVDMRITLDNPPKGA